MEKLESKVQIQILDVFVCISHNINNIGNIIIIPSMTGKMNVFTLGRMWHKVNFFKQSKSGFNPHFSFTRTSCLTKAEEISLSYYIPIAGKEQMNLYFSLGH